MSNRKLPAMDVECPEYLALWDYEKNADISPADISSGSNKKVWWKCKNGHSWLSAPHKMKNNKRLLQTSWTAIIDYSGPGKPGALPAIPGMA